MKDWVSLILRIGNGTYKGLVHFVETAFMRVWIGWLGHSKRCELLGTLQLAPHHSNLKVNIFYLLA